MALVGDRHPTSLAEPDATNRRAAGGVFDLLTEGPAGRLALYRGCCGFAIAASLLAVLIALMPRQGVQGLRASAIIAVGITTGLVSLAFLLLAGRFPPGALEHLTVTGSFVYLGAFSLIVYFSGPGVAPTSVMGPLAVALVSVMLFSARAAVGIAACLGAAYAVVLAAQTDVAPVARWTVTLGLTSVSALVVRDLIARIHVKAQAEQMARTEAEAARAELEQVSRHKGEFLAGMTHELRTPLNAIIGFSEVLAQELFGELNEKQAEYVDDVRTSGQHLLTLINDVLDLAKVEAGRMELDLGPVDLADVLGGTAARFREQAARHGVTLSVEVDPDLGLVEADGDKVSQVVDNLVSNAVKFSSDGGHVLVAGRRRTHAVEVAVRDTGPGIAAEDHERIFEDFHHGSAPGRPREPGAGLGLPLARRFVELHGGRMDVESRPAEGATVSFSLPLVPASHGETEAGPATPPLGSTGSAGMQPRTLPSVLEVLAGGEGSGVAPMMFRTGGFLAAGCCLIGLLALALSSRAMPGLRVVPAALTSLAGIAVALVLVLTPRLMGPSAMWKSVPRLCAAATILVSLEVYFAGPSGGPTAAQIYACIGGGCFLGMSRRMAIGQLSLIGVAYAVVLAAQTGVQGALTQWTVVLATSAGLGVIVAWIGGRIYAKARAEQEARAEAEAARAELEQVSRHKSEFLASMSHELRTPLNAIIGFSEVLAQELFGTLNEKQAEYVDDVRTSGQHLLTLINDVLDLAKVEAGRMELDLGPVDLADVLSSAAALFREQAARHGITLSAELDPDLGVVQADGRKVTQAVYNLVSNAVKFTPDGGTVEVSGRRRARAVEVAIRDTGPGIAPEDHERIFEDFRQGPARGRPRQPGTGLGLPLARRFVELHGGRMSVESRPGEGAIVSFSLPLVRAAGGEINAQSSRGLTDSVGTGSVGSHQPEESVEWRS